MKKKIVVLLIIGICFASCKSKKAYSDKLRTKNVLSERNKFKPANSGKDGEVNLPNEPSKFISFRIESVSEYIETFAETAQLEMVGYGIPASITLAQGLLESGNGKGELAMKTNNHFGIKCHKGWEGDYDFHDDDEKGECFRKYNHPMYSFRDHSVFLTTRSRYAFLFNLKHTDYKGWAKGLRKAGYATDPRYPQKLIYLIEKNGLHKYDRQVKKAGYDRQTVMATESDKMHTVEKGDTLYSLSRKYYMPVNEIMQLNKLRSSNLSIGQRIKVKISNIN
ncbi:glucosaminidase domain-containing protein [Maribacter sp. ACAM166]|uniref:glucosaminidase domain-containing protein n=1 Tax=Maribacter sp. ACAM166 TaxID=2508996 RepID=UPI0010FD5A7D|nr:glucosaminidase domain-containing protein [Maribacter sp. ACAM166]TLP74392.1 LysM peptidoglycan-binding domain-containing protein [Maribacter sp. ACAM166]